MNNMRSGVRVLVVWDEPGVRNLVSLALKHQGYLADFLDDTSEAILRIRQMGSRYSGVLLDVTSDGAAAAVIREARQQQPALPVIGLVDRNCSDTQAFDESVQKPVNAESLRRALQNCFHWQNEAVGGDPGDAVVEIGAPVSVWQTEMQPLIGHVSAADVPVLVQGETGVGKEVLSRQIHALSQRSKKRFLKVNCAALPSELIESELFGYERGAFTGAFKATLGKFEMADGGTILLDEIGDMDFKLQAKLLQVLQDSEFIRLGSSEPRRVDVRVIAATHCDLERAIAEGRFREDLYYRLNIVTLYIPPLRERRDEILPLAHLFLRKHATPASLRVEITSTLRDALLDHDWPGNIRELENVMRRLLVLRRPDMIAKELLTRSRRRTPMAAPVVLTPTATVAPAPVVQAPPPTPLQPVISMPSPSATKSMPDLRHSAMNGHEYHDTEIVVPSRPVPEVHEHRGSVWGDTLLPNRAPHPVRAESISAPWSVLDRVDQARREAETEAILSALQSTLWNRKRAAELLSIDYKALLYKMKKLGIVERAASVAI